jgi:hypothetical protein
MRRRRRVGRVGRGGRGTGRRIMGIRRFKKNIKSY